MKRGEVWWIAFSGQDGEIKKRRPAIIISNNASNQFLNRVQVIPLTSNTKKLYPSEAYVSVLGKQGKAMADQIATVSKQKLISKMDTLKDVEMFNIEEIIKMQLGLS